jgi:hypothetical protein
VISFLQNRCSHFGQICPIDLRLHAILLETSSNASVGTRSNLDYQHRLCFVGWDAEVIKSIKGFFRVLGSIRAMQYCYIKVIDGSIAPEKYNTVQTEAHCGTPFLSEHLKKSLTVPYMHPLTHEKAIVNDVCFNMKRATCNVFFGAVTSTAAMGRLRMGNRNHFPIP